MRLIPARVRGAGFILWHSRHELYHVLLGLVWAWYLRERWNEFNLRWIWYSVIGSLLPDIDHLLYFFVYGRKEPYTRQIAQFLRAGQWRNVTIFIETGHKMNTHLFTHNYYIMAMLLALSFLSSFVEWNVGVVLFGAMIIHYSFDVADDLIILGHLNENWKRWGKAKNAP